MYLDKCAFGCTCMERKVFRSLTVLDQIIGSFYTVSKCNNHSECYIFQIVMHHIFVVQVKVV